jgi:hypothetical protein
MSKTTLPLQQKKEDANRYICNDWRPFLALYGFVIIIGFKNIVKWFQLFKTKKGHKTLIAYLSASIFQSAYHHAMPLIHQT